MVEPLPLVPATWMTGGSRRSGCPSFARATAGCDRATGRSSADAAASGAPGCRRDRPSRRIPPQGHAISASGRQPGSLDLNSQAWKSGSQRASFGAGFGLPASLSLRTARSRLDSPRLEPLVVGNGLRLDHARAAGQRFDDVAVDRMAVHAFDVADRLRLRRQRPWTCPARVPFINTLTMPGQCLAQLVAMHDHVDHAVRQQVFGALEAFGQAARGWSAG